MGRENTEHGDLMLENGIVFGDPTAGDQQSDDSQHDDQAEELDNFPALIDIEDLRRSYLDDITKTPLLTAEEEVSLTRSLQHARKARRELVEGKVSQKRKAELNSVIESGSAARERLLMAAAAVRTTATEPTTICTGMAASRSGTQKN